MKLQYRPALKEVLVNMLKDFDIEKVLDHVIDNNLSYKSIRNEAIKSEFELLSLTGKPIMDIYTQLSEEYMVSESLILYIIRK